MGTYTEFKTKEIRLRKDIPDVVFEFFERCFYEDTWKAWEIAEESCNPIFDQQFFKEERWMRVFKRISFPEMTENYQRPYLKKKGNYWVLFLWTDINYGITEMIEFVEWITPFVAGHKPREFIGWRRTEGFDRINLYIHREKPKKICLPFIIKFPEQEEFPF